MWAFKLETRGIRDFYRSGRPPIDHIDGDVMPLLRTFPFHTVRTLAEKLSARPSTILHHLRDSLGLKPSQFRFVPLELTCQLKEKQVVICRELLK
jgi:hypothetical protein